MELSKRRVFPLHLLFLLSVVILIFAYIRWEDVVIRHPDGSYAVGDATTDKVADRVDRINRRAVFYKLVAASNGYFECPLCPPESRTGGRYFLNFKEIFKYGVTIAENSRYSQAELARWNLRYEKIAEGNYADMLILETTYMAEYPLILENIRRPLHRRLVTPPGSGIRLR